MKIEGNRQTQDTEATEASKKTAAAFDKAVKRTVTDTSSATSRDRVEVSADAQLMTSALNATQKVARRQNRPGRAPEAEVQRR